jgi:hypothetical protein
MLHVVPISVGFGNWIAVKLWGRRLFHDHYEAGESMKKPAAVSDAEPTL